MSWLSLSKSVPGWQYYINEYRPAYEGAIGNPNVTYLASLKTISPRPERWHFQTVIFSFIFFFVTRYVCKAFCERYITLFQKGDQKFQDLWLNRMTSTIHATIVSILSLYMIFIDDGLGNGFRLWSEAITSEIEYPFHARIHFTAFTFFFCHLNSPLCQLIQLFATGYMVFDTIDIYRFPNAETIPMTLHHIVGATSFWLSVCVHRCNYYGPCLLLMEATTPFLNFRWWFSKYHMKDSRLYLWNGYIFTFGFFFFRIVNSLVIYWNFEITTKADHIGGEYALYVTLHVELAAIFLLNIFWFYKVVKGALLALRKIEGLKVHKDQ